MPKHYLSYLLCLFATFQLYCQESSNKKNKASEITDTDGLLWSDEFDVDGVIDDTKWFHQTELPSGGSWYNGEIQHYTNRIENAVVQQGVLSIIAKKENFTDQGHTKNYTSARLNSKYAFQYGRVQIRAKLPIGIGTWPAIWMLGKNITESGAYWADDFGTTPWPACGEIDIMEHWGSNQNYVQSAMHTPSSYGGTLNHGGQRIETASSEFHIYELDWNAERMIFSVDGKPHYTYNPEVKDANTWPYDAPQYFLLNIAIQPSINSSFIQSSMDIDYVRVYEATPTNGGDASEDDVAYDIYDNFEGDGTITSWTEDASLMDLNFTNPYKEGINTSENVLRYEDEGTTYANIRFDTASNFDLTTESVFTLKIYVDPSSISGNQPNQISLKLQDGTLGQPWSTQSEIIKTVQLGIWQEIKFDFANDSYKNFSNNSLNPMARKDFNRVVLQVNSENNQDKVVAYIDDFSYKIETLSNNVQPLGKLQITPNPTNGKIHIKGNFEEATLLTLTGKEIQQGNNNVLDISLYPKGIYLLKIQRGNTFEITKIIKK